MNSRSRWSRSVGAVVLVGGLLITGWGLGVTAAAPLASNPGNPFQAILDNQNEVLAAIAGISGGGQDGNHTIRWDQALPAAQRFVILAAFNNDAVLDRETGLVWEKSPNTVKRTWNDARSVCADKAVGGRKG